MRTRTDPPRSKPHALQLGQPAGFAASNGWCEEVRLPCFGGGVRALAFPIAGQKAANLLPFADHIHFGRIRSTSQDGKSNEKNDPF